MFKHQKGVVVMPTYNAAQTLRMTYDEVMAQEIVDQVIVIDNKSNDETVSIASKLPIKNPKQFLSKNSIIYVNK